jgi:histone H3/H4
MADALIVASKVRTHLKEKGVKMSGELPDALNKKVMALLDEAAARARGNKRSTVKPQDV